MSIDSIVSEVREEFHIPPYFSDKHLKNFVKEAIQYIENLNPTCDIDEDYTAMSLLKYRVFYAYNNKLSEYYEDFRTSIISWQMQSFGAETEG